MTPFNLEDALNGAPIIDRQGDPVEFIAYVEKAVKASQVITLHSDGNICSSHVNGRYWGTGDSPEDLFMALAKRTMWVNLCPISQLYYQYHSQTEADSHARLSRLGGKAHPITIEE